MSERTKKILFAIFFVIFSVGMGYGLYYLFILRGQTPLAPVTQEAPGFGGKLSSASKGGPTGEATATPGEFPTSPGQPTTAVPTPSEATGPVKTRLLRDGVTLDVTSSPGGNGARFYNPEDGRFYKINDDGTITALGDKQFYNVDTVSWGKKSDKAIMDFPDGSNIYYDFETKQQVALPKHWQDFSFSQDDSHIAAKSIGTDPDSRFLLISNPNGTEAKAIESLGDNAAQVDISWSPNSQVVAFAKTGEPQGGGQQEIFLVGQHHENFNSLIVPGQDFLPNWSPSGKQLLYSTWSIQSDGKPNLWVVAGDPANIGSSRSNLNLQTWADKCAWASETDLYCGIPQGLPQNAGLQRSDFTSLPDDVYHIDLRSGASVRISAPDQTHPIRSPVITKDGNTLIFTDAGSGKLYSYDLR